MRAIAMIEPNGRTSADNAFIGVRSMYETAGFEEVGRFDRWRCAAGSSW